MAFLSNFATALVLFMHAVIGGGMSTTSNPVPENQPQQLQQQTQAQPQMSATPTQSVSPQLNDQQTVSSHATDLPQSSYTEPTFGFTLSYPAAIGIQVTDDSTPLAPGESRVTVIGSTYTSPGLSSNPIRVSINSASSAGLAVSNIQRENFNGVLWTIGSNSTISFKSDGTKTSQDFVTADAYIGDKYALFLTRNVGPEGLAADLASITQMAASVHFNTGDVQTVQNVAQQQNANREKALDAMRIATLREIQLQLDLYRASYKNFPVSLATIASQFGKGGVPRDPTTDAEYLYSSTGDSYRLCAVVADPPAALGTDATFSNGQYCISE